MCVETVQLLVCILSVENSHNGFNIYMTKVSINVLAQVCMER